MDKHVLKIREQDRINFDLIKSGEKTIETRAGTDKFRKIKAGDILILKCGKDRLEKKVIRTYYFETIEALVKTLDLKKIMPFVSSVEQAKQVWYSFPNYEQKIKKYGLVAFELC